MKTVLLFLMLATALTFAEETNLTITVDGIRYDNVRFRRESPVAVTVFHSTGVAVIPMEKLSPDLQKQLGFDAQKALEWQIAQTKAKAEAKRKAESSVSWILEVERVFQNGFIAVGNVGSYAPATLRRPGVVFKGSVEAHRLEEERAVRAQQSHNSPSKTEEVEIFVIGYPKGNHLSVGNRIQVYAYKEGDITIDGHTLERWVYCEPPHNEK